MRVLTWAFVVVASCGIASAEPGDTIAALDEDVSWLFIQTADGMAFDGTTLTLSGIDPVVVMFADRPHRVADTVAVHALVDAWTKGDDDSFRVDPPNAGITALVGGRFEVATVELSEPRLDGTTLSFSVEVLEGHAAGFRRPDIGLYRRRMQPA